MVHVQAQGRSGREGVSAKGRQGGLTRWSASFTLGHGVGGHLVDVQGKGAGSCEERWIGLGGREDMMA